MTKGEKIKHLRKSYNISQTELADKINVSKQTLYKYENDVITNIPSDKIEALASALNTTPAYIMGWNDTQTHKGKQIPVYGRVAAGIPLEMIEDIIDMEEITDEMANKGTYFGLQIHGHSMEPRICDGDVVIIRKQEDAESGEIVIATVNGNDATCKKLIKHDDGISLISLNPAFDPMFFTNAEIEEKPVKIIGKVIELRGKI